MKNTFKIKSFDDYHEIYPYSQGEKSEKGIELGCFPPKTGGYFRYFAVIYKGRKPSVEKVLIHLKKLTHPGKFVHYRTSEDIGVSWKEIESEVKENYCN